MAQYEDAKGGVSVKPAKGITPGTWRWLCVEYFRSADYLRLDPDFQRVRRGVLENTFDEKIAPGSPKLFRDMPLFKMDANAIEVLRDRKLEFPEGANNRVKAIRAVFKWAVKKKHRDGKPYVAHNAAREVSYFESNNPDGYHTWTVEEVRKFQKRHPLGTKAHLALSLLLFSGQRRSDMVRFGREHVSGGKLVFTQFKGRNRKPKQLALPMLPELRRVIDASPCGKVTFLENDLGRPFTAAGFGNWFHDRCVEADVPGRAHGLRKAGATIAANNGATAHQLMAIFGWDTLKMAEKYTKAADQSRLAEAAMHMLASDIVVRPTSKRGGTFGEENEEKSTPNFVVGAQERTRTSTALTAST